MLNRIVLKGKVTLKSEYAKFKCGITSAVYIGRSH